MSYELGNRALATQGISEARSQSSLAKAANDTHRAKVLAVNAGAYKVGILSESGLVVRIHDGLLAPTGESYAVDDIISVKIHEQSGEAVVMSGGGGGGCQSAITAWGTYYT